MFGTIRRHQGWLWIVIAGFTIVSFIVYFNPASRMGGSGRSAPEGAFGTINRQPISMEDYQQATREVALMQALRRQRPDTETPVARYEIFKQLFLIAKMNQLGIHPTTEATAELARSMLGGRISYDDFVDKNLKPFGLNGDDFDRFLRHQLGLAQLQTLAGVSGQLVTPGEAETLYRSEHRDIETKLVWFPVSNYLSAVTVTPDALAKYYSNEVANYSVPDQITVNYVKFDATNYFATAKAYLTNLDVDVQRDMDNAGTNLYPGTKTPEESKAKIKEAFIMRREMYEAQRDAALLADEVDKRGNHPDDLEKLAKEKGLTMRTSAPFDEETGPQDLKVSEDFGKAAFELTPDAPIRGDLQGEDCFYVISLKTKIPTRIPPLKEIEAKVTTDYREMLAHQLAGQAAAKLGTAITNELNVSNGVTLAKTFADICAETGNKAETLPRFSLSTTNLGPEIEDRVDLAMLKRAGFGTPVGAASPVLNMQHGSFILYVDKLLPVDESKVKSGVTEYLSMLRKARENDAFNLWINSQIQEDPDALQKFQALIKEMQNAPPAAAERSAP